MDVRLPNLGEGVETGTVAAIFVSAGDTVVRDQALIEIESEKAVASVPSPAAGRVAGVHIEVGGEVRTGSLLVTLESERAEPEADRTSKAPVPSRPTEPRLGPVATKPASPKPATDQPPELPEGVDPAASPSIRKIARDLGIDLRRIRGTARGGRIVLGDVRDYIAKLQELPSTTSPAPPTATPPVDFSQWGEVEKAPSSAIRKTIAARMLESWRRVPHVTQFADADISRLTALRQKWRSAYEQERARLTLTPILLRALARVLPRHPLLNSSLDGESLDVITKKYYHFGLAVDTEAGLFVPVIRNADQKSLLDLAREVEALGERARQRKMTREDLLGGTFTVSNQGGIGGQHFTPIINYPEVAILGVGRGRDVVGMSDGNPEARMMLPLALSHDHRLVDGADGVRFLMDLMNELEKFPEEEFELG